MEAPAGAVDFVELAPENYVGSGGQWRRRLDAIRERYPVLTHGLSLSMGGEAPFDPSFLAAVAGFLRDVESPWHSDHLCWSSTEETHFHELLPIPFTRKNLERVVARVKHVQNMMPVRFAIENVSAYARHAEDEMSEAAFVREVVEQSGCALLLDVNNVFVNSQNFGGNAWSTLAELPLESVVQIHIAGFSREAPDLVIDTHGAAIDEGVYGLLTAALARTGPVPVLLERDHDIPAFEVLAAEIERIRAIGREVLG